MITNKLKINDSKTEFIVSLQTTQMFSFREIIEGN